MGVSDQFSVTARWTLKGKSSERIGSAPPPCWEGQSRRVGRAGTPAPPRVEDRDGPGGGAGQGRDRVGVVLGVATLSSTCWYSQVRQRVGGPHGVVPQGELSAAAEGGEKADQQQVLQRIKPTS